MFIWSKAPARGLGKATQNVRPQPNIDILHARQC